jgi:hypothetical protein
MPMLRSACELPLKRAGMDATKPSVWADGFARLLQLRAGKRTDKRAQYLRKRHDVAVIEVSRNVLADSVFLLIERLPFGPGDMAAVLRGFEPLLLANKPIFRMKGMRLEDINFARFERIIDPPILDCEARINLRPAGMALSPSGGCELAASSEKSQRQESDR